MNSILATNNTDAIKVTDLPTITSSASTGMNGFDVTSTDVSPFRAGSFSETMQEAFAQLVPDDVLNEASIETSEATELAGNSLPIADVFPELSADGNRSLTDFNINVSDLLPIENKLQSLNTGDQLVMDTSQVLPLNSVGTNSVETDAVEDNNAKSELHLSSPSSSPSSSLTSPLIGPAVQSLDEFIKPVVIPASGEPLVQKLTRLLSNEIRQPEIRQPVEQDATQVVAQSMTRPVTQSAAHSVTNLVVKSSQQSSVQLVTQVEPEVLTADNIVNNNNARNIAAPVEDMPQLQQVSLANTIAKVIGKGSDKIDIHQISTVNGSSNNGNPKSSIESVGDQVHDESFVLNDVLSKSKPVLENSLAQFQLKSSLAASSSQDGRVINHGSDNGSDEFNKVEGSLLPPTTTAALSLDEDAALLAPLNVLSSSLRTLLHARSSSNIKAAQENVLNASSNASAAIPENLTAKININTGLEMNLLPSNSLQPFDGLSLTSELSGLMADKIQTLPNVLSQQQLFSATQSSQVASLLQTAATAVSPHSDSASVITHPAVNNLSNINLPTVSPTEITEAFGRTAWSQGMGKQVLSMVNQNIGSAEIRLNPAHLGPIEILIDMSEDQVNVSLSSRHAIVREAMEQALPKLREMLDENGFSLADADISKHSFAEQREQNTENRKSTLNMSNSNHAQLISSEITESTRPAVSSSTGTVDYFV